jgi:uncharacterized protein (DUF1697 family)
VARFVALLRAVNVAGHGKLAMSELRVLCEGLGLTEVATLLQSGNVVFSSSKSSGALEKLLQAAALQELDLNTDFFVRSAGEWAEIVAANPFVEAAKRDPGHLVVMALKEAPDNAAVSRLRSAIKGRESVRAVGKQLYITYPDGIGRSKLTNAAIEKALGTRGTARNWNTGRSSRGWWGSAKASGGDGRSRRRRCPGRPR